MSGPSGYLGFDPVLVEALWTAMSRAVGELAILRSADVEAEGAMRRIEQARVLLAETWQPFTAGLVGCRAMEGYQPAFIDAGDLINSWLRSVAAEQHWRVATDPAATIVDPLASRPMTADDARRLGASLSGPAGSEPMTGDEIEFLRTSLDEIATDPALVAAFLPSFTTLGWTAVCDQLGELRRKRVTEARLYDGRIDRAEAAGLEAIDGAFAALATILIVDRAAHPRSNATLLLADMHPYAAALLVQHLSLGADDLVAVTRTLVDREQLWLLETNETNTGPRAADLLFETVLRTDGAPTAYVMSTLDDPGLVMDAAFDPSLGNRLLVMGTDPANMSSPDAAVAVPTLVRWVLNASTFNSYASYNMQLPVVAADLLGPYVLPVLRSTADAYGMTDVERRAIQELVLGDVVAIDHLIAARAQVVAALGPRIAAGVGSASEQIARLRDMGDMLAFVDTAVRSAGIAHAVHDRAEWALMWTAAGYVASAVSVGSASAWANLPGPTLNELRALAENEGWGPPTVDDVRSTTLATFDRVSAATAAALVCARFDRMVADGDVPVDSPPPPMPDMDAEHVGESYSTEFTTWLAGLEADQATTFELIAIKDAILSGHEASANANEETLG